MLKIKKIIEKLKMIICILETVIATSFATDYNNEYDTSYESQLRLIAENTDVIEMGKNNKEYYGKYAVTDFNRNGRLEIIFSYNAGSGNYSYNDYYEVNESYNDIIKYNVELDWTDSEADIVGDSEIDVYFDEEKNIYYYIFNDYTRDGLDLAYYNKRAIYFTGNEVKSIPLGFNTSFLNKEEDMWIDEYRSADKENIVSEDEYIHAADIYFSGFTKDKVKIVWLSHSENDIFYGTTDEIFSVLQKSLSESSFAENN